MMKLIKPPSNKGVGPIIGIIDRYDKGEFKPGQFANEVYSIKNVFRYFWYRIRLFFWKKLFFRTSYSPDRGKSITVNDSGKFSPGMWFELLDESIKRRPVMVKDIIGFDMAPGDDEMVVLKFK